MSETKTTSGKLEIKNRKFLCPICGEVEFWIEISIPPYESMYCQKCYAKWINENIPKLTEIGEKK